MDELVSIIITTYARPHTLGRAIDSLVVQTYKNIEIIVVDDNANAEMNGEVEKIVQSFNDSRIILIKNESNIGGALSRNVGIKYARGKYIAFLDDDDEYSRTKIEKQYALMKSSDNPKLALVYCGYDQYGLDGKLKIHHNDHFAGNCVFDGMYDCIAPTSMWFCTKSSIEKVDGFSNVPCKQDSYLIVKLLICGFEVDTVHEILVNYYSDAGVRISNSSHQKRIQGEEALRDLCRSHYDLITEEQAKEVEYSFSCRLASHYFAMKMYPQFWGALLKVLKKPLRHRSLSAYKHILVGY